MCLKFLEKQEQTKPQSCRGKAIIKIMAEINEKEINTTTQGSNETKSCFFEKINNIDKP
jgi:hypothetical protein